ncbi:hypothetical protein F4680DRAFT_418962, partial [Xylaria scruposa]
MEHDYERLGSSIGTVLRHLIYEAEEELLYSYLDSSEVRGNITCYQKRFFRTRTGRMGLGSVGIEPGDIVVVLLGGRVPYILRKAFRGYYFLICDSYVHGIMNGEIVEEWKASKRNLEFFKL